MNIKAIGAAAVLAALASPSVSLAGGAPAIPGSVSTVTVALKFSYRAPGTFVKGEDGKTERPLVETYTNDWHISNEAKMTEENTFEYVSKIKTQKFGNKELLLALIDAEILPKHGDTPFIAGWSIVFVNATLTDEEGYSEETDSKFYAVHKTEGDIVDLSNVISPGAEGGYAEKGTYKDYFKEVDGEHPQSIHTITSSFSWKESVQLLINFEGPVIFGEPEEENHYAKLQGIFTQSIKLTTVGSEKTPVIVMGAGKLASISGEGPALDVDEEPDRSVPEGTLAISPGKATQDVSAYPDLIQD